MNTRPWLAPLALIAAGFAAYSNSFSGAFLFDDFRHIVENARIRDLSHPLGVMGGTTRPLVAWTFALNFALGGLRVWGYHAVNLSIHGAAGLALWVLLRRHLRSDLAFWAAGIWLVHPLQTQAVNYVVQRSELLMSFFTLLTLIFLGRSADEPDSPRPKIFCAASCALGMLSKPIMATAPWMALAYDRFFLSASWRELWERRGRLYGALAATYGVLFLSLLNGREEYATDVGFQLEHTPPGIFILTQGKVILHYLRLAFWPHPLVFDYGWPIQVGADSLRAWGILLLLLALTAWSCRRRRAAGFLGIWFFLTLAATSLIPISDLAFEYRMYLALAAPVVGVVAGADRLIRSARARGLLLAGAVLLLGGVTFQRNAVYRSGVSLWRDTAAKRPLHPRAHANLGAALHMEGRLEEARFEYLTALRLDPRQENVHSNLGLLLENAGDLEGARREYEMALKIKPKR